MLGKTYRVLPTKKKHGNDHGECVHRQCQIYVDMDDCVAQQRDTLLHELVHALDEDDQVIKLKERQVRLVATLLLTLMRQNPELVAFLMAPD